MPALAVLALIEGIIQLTPEAIALWQQLKPILEQGRNPTPEEWLFLNMQADLAHQAAQE